MDTKPKGFVKCPCPGTDGFCANWNGKGVVEELTCNSDVNGKDCPHWREGHPGGIFVRVPESRLLAAIPDREYREPAKTRRR